MAGKFALIIGNSRYEDLSLGRLSAPDLDAQGLEEVLKAPEVGHFDEVTTLLNEGCASVRRAVARFYDQRQRDDLLLLYFSGHGVKDEQGHLYLALRDTESKLLAGTAIETAFISDRMDRSFSKRQVLVLDCCHSGAFSYGTKAAQGVSVGTAEAFEGTGLGRVILTATDSTQYAWEGDQIIGDAQNSLFTHFLIDGLKTGAADRDDDGVVTVDELYDYVREQVLNTTPRQTPHKWTYRQQGEIVLAHNPFVKRSALPPEIEESIRSKLSSLRMEAVRDLAVLLRGHHLGRARAALAALKDLSLDDSRKVANAAGEALKVYDEEERRRGAAPHLTAARLAIERKQFGKALESLRQATEVDPQAEGVAELTRIAEEAQASSQTQAERAVPQPNLSDAVAPSSPVDSQGARAFQVESHQAVAARPAARHAESPATAEDHGDAHASDIFISYAREDREKARALAQVLTARGWKVWWDRKIAPGEAFDEVIERELGTCKCAIVLWSARSVHATWVRNEARRAARRKVLVPILLDPVETPLEFENLQAADLTSWKAAADHPEFEAVFDRIQELSPIPDERLARAAVEDARREFGAGRKQAALRSLEQFRPAHDLVTRALTELRAEAERLERERAEAVLREAEAAQRQRELATATAQIEALLGRPDLDAAEQALAATEKKFERPADLGPFRERLNTLRDQAQQEQLARKAVEDARHEFEDGHHQAAIERLERFRPVHALASSTLTELRAEVERIERERAAEAERIERERAEAVRLEAEAVQREAETVRREAEAAQRQRELDAEKARIEALVGRREPAATEEALPIAARTFEPSSAPSRLGQSAENLQQAPLAADAAVEILPRSLSRFTSRPVLAAVAVLLALIVGTWLAVRPGRTPVRPRDVSQQPSQPIESATPPRDPSPVVRTPSVDNASVSRLTESPPAEPTPIDVAPPAPAAVAPSRSSESAAIVSPSERLEQLRTEARTQAQSGHRDQALNTIVQGLQIAPKDPVLRKGLDSMLREAQVNAGRSKQAARDADARDRAAKTFGQGLAKENEAERLRRTGRIEAATRALWFAADQFSAAAKESRRSAGEEEAAEQALTRKAQNERVVEPSSPKPIQVEKKPFNLELENEAAIQTLRRYESAYASLRAEAVRSVYPSAPIDQLEKEFAGASRYTLKVEIFGAFTIINAPSQLLATATGRVTQDVLQKSGATNHSERAVTIHLEKPGTTWLITQIR